MSVAGELTAAGTPPERIDLDCTIVMDEVEGQGHQIVGSEVEIVVRVDGVDDDALQAAVAQGARRLSVLAAARAGRRMGERHRPARVTFAELAAARRTHKSFGSDPVPRETLLGLLDVARLAPTHHLNQPWRFRVLGPETLAELKRVAGEKEAQKLDRAPTLVVASAALTGDLVMDEEDVCATAAAIALVLLAATERGIATYWRTPSALRTQARP